MGITNAIIKLIYRCTSRKPRQMIVQSRLWTRQSYKLVEITKSMKQEVYALQHITVQRREGGEYSQSTETRCSLTRMLSFFYIKLKNIHSKDAVLTLMVLTPGQRSIYTKPFKIALKSHFSLINKGF